MPESVMWNVATQLALMALTGACTFLWGRIKGAAAERKKRAEEADEERDKNRAVIRLLLYFRIHDLVKDAKGAGRMAEAEKQQLEEAYRYYHEDYAGNGVGTQLYQEGMALPTE